jgi:diaminohydroxyphosphoribosylaminopyrimidine deaminase/5-amino-6-(5-phosphoribosylamino)uracil reductase
VLTARRFVVACPGPGEEGTTVRDDAELMAQAADIGFAARRRTAPNPWVGSVIVRDGVVVGAGATQPPGGAHAEIVALREAADRARGATLFATLEPCSHQGRTAQCSEALIEAGVARVVVALEDPDERVAGRGIERLRAAGVTVEVGIGADRATRDLAPYLHHRRTGRAFAVVKTATSIDGRTAAADGSSQWITGVVARADGRELRADAQAVVVGAGTALADRPTLTARDCDPVPGHQPVRVVLDARGRVPATGPLFDSDIAPTLVVTTAAAAPDAVDAWRAAGAKVEVVAPAPGGGVELCATLELLGGEGVLGALFEGGATVHASLLQAGLVNRIVGYVGGALLGSEGLASFAGPGPATLADATRWRVVDAIALDGDARLTWEPV